MEMSRIDKLYARIPVTAKLADGSPATLAGVDVAALAPQTTPSASTAWTPSTFSADVATVLIAGPDADPAGAIVIPAPGADLWIRVTDNPEVDATKVDRIVIK